MLAPRLSRALLTRAWALVFRFELLPFTIEQVEMFKIVNGEISKVEVVLGPRVPFGMRSPFDMRDLWQEAAATPDPAPAEAGDSETGRLQKLEDRQAIEELFTAYGATLDRRDFAAFGRLFARSRTDGVPRGRTNDRDADSPLAVGAASARDGRPRPSAWPA